MKLSILVRMLAQVLRAGQPVLQLLGLVNQDGQMLGTDRVIFAHIAHQKQGDFIFGAFTNNAGGDRCFH